MVGDVDWVQIALANDNNWAIINKRIFDLKFGTSILVAPQKDGSLRFLQLPAPGSYQQSNQKQFFDEYVAGLAKNESVNAFFTNENTIGEQ